MDKLKIGNKFFNSRLMLGTGKYKTIEDTISSIDESNAELITVAIRRLPTNLNNDNISFLKELNWQKLWLLPNTAGCQTAEEAIRMAFFRSRISLPIGSRR